MRDRNEEYWGMIRELAQPPEELAGSVERARKRVRRARLARRLLQPAATLAGAAACFVLMVNAFPTFALACSSLPVIRELAAAAAFSPSLSAAVAHDYVQYIGQSQTVDGVTVDLGYAIVDQAQAVFFYSADGGRLYTSPDLTGADGEPIGGYSLSYSQNGQEDGLSSMEFSFIDGDGLPDRFTLEIYLMPTPEREQGLAPEQAASPAYGPAPDTPADSAPDAWRDPREDPGVLRFTFDVTLDSSRIAQSITVPVGRWIELDGQRILVDRLGYSPTRTVLYLDEDAANTAWLKSLRFWFEDETGTRYEEIDGSLLSSGAVDDGSRSQLTYYFQSFYYGQPEGLTLCVSKAEWLDKDAPRVSIDLTTGESTGLPEGVEIGEIARTGDDVRVEVWSPLAREGFAQSFTSTYWDPEGGEHSWNRMSYTKPFDDEGEYTAIKETLYLDGYPWDTVELELSYTSVSGYEPPVRVPLTVQN